jgi:hypothetical protein
LLGGLSIKQFVYIARYQAFASLAIAEWGVFGQFATADVHRINFLIQTKLNGLEACACMG